MQKSIVVQGRTVTYTLRRSVRARRVKITVNHDGQIILSVPRFVPFFLAEKFLRTKKDWILKSILNFEEKKTLADITRVGGDYASSKQIAKDLVGELIAQYNQDRSFTFRRITIKNHKTRWGSCSKDGNLNFNYRLALLPRELAEYIVVHELCHLRELNHSKYFWAHVGNILPNYKDLRKELRKKIIL